jgi:hypothetical protein
VFHHGDYGGLDRGSKLLLDYLKLFLGRNYGSLRLLDGSSLCPSEWISDSTIGFPFEEREERLDSRYPKAYGRGGAFKGVDKGIRMARLHIEDRYSRTFCPFIESVEGCPIGRFGLLTAFGITGEEEASLGGIVFTNLILVFYTTRQD